MSGFLGFFLVTLVRLFPEELESSARRRKSTCHGAQQEQELGISDSSVQQASVHITSSGVYLCVGHPETLSFTSNPLWQPSGQKGSCSEAWGWESLGQEVTEPSGGSWCR